MTMTDTRDDGPKEEARSYDKPDPDPNLKRLI